ncbi:MAG: hypothetical protein KAX49_15570 [Halanaerobiales bacterium]|nr:hypothetical protein [Halanaerobiales bacterium]
MQVKRFLELSGLEKRKLFEYIMDCGPNSYFSDFDGMLKDYTSVIFDGGKNHFSLWDEGRVKGSLGMITKDVKERGEIFITGIYINEEGENGLKLLLEFATNDLNNI